MGRWHRFVLGTARFAPQLLPFVVRAAFAMARQVGKAEFVRLVYGGSPADVAMTRNSRMFEAVDCGSDVVLSEGFDAARAYAQEVSIVHCTEWRSELEALRDTIPVVNIFGTEDQGVPPATVDDYAQDYPWVRFVRVEAAGSFLFFEHWDRVLNELEKMLRNVT
jgi:pimeloyl-ACP methyl ester carboxylesterase